MSPLERRYAVFKQEIIISGKTFKVQRIRSPDGYGLTLSCDRTRLQTWNYATVAEANQAYRLIASTLHDIAACFHPANDPGNNPANG